MGDFEMCTVGSISKVRMRKFHSSICLCFQWHVCSLEATASERRKSLSLMEEQDYFCPGLKANFLTILAMWYFIGRCSSNIKAEVLT